MAMTKRELSNEERGRRAERRERRQDRKDLRSDFNHAGSSIVGIVLIIIILFNIPSVVAGNDEVSSYFSFERFMNMLAQAPTIDMTWITNVLQPITADWGVFQFFAEFLNSLLTLLQGICFLAVGIVNLVSYLLYFLKFLFNL